MKRKHESIKEEKYETDAKKSKSEKSIEQSSVIRYELYLSTEFDVNQWEEIKGNAVILTNKNTAYFVIDNKLVTKDEKPQIVEAVSRQGIPLCSSIKPVKYTNSVQKKRNHPGSHL